jgi:hypothetical protein
MRAISLAHTHTHSYSRTQAHGGAPCATGIGSVGFECDGASSKCVNNTLVWSCDDLDCANPSYKNMCGMALSSQGLRGTIPAQLGDLRCADRIEFMCASAQPRVTAECDYAGMQRPQW